MTNVNIANESLQEGFNAGNGTVGTSEAKISAINFPVRKHIVIRANTGNTNTVKVGTVGNATNGFVLLEGETTPPIYVNETDKVAVIGGAADQGYSWVAN